MTEVKFYILPQADLDARYRFACRHAEQAVKLGRRVYLHVADEAQARQLDELMWNFRPDSFLPHACLDTLQREHWPDTPVAIGWQTEPGPFHDVLINLAPDVPGFVGHFERVSEIVVQEPSVLEATRQSYKFYKDQGFPLYTHKL